MSKSRRLTASSDDGESNPRMFTDAETTYDIASVEPDANLSRAAELDVVDRAWSWLEQDED